MRLSPFSRIAPSTLEISGVICLTFIAQYTGTGLNTVMSSETSAKYSLSENDISSPSLEGKYCTLRRISIPTLLTNIGISEKFSLFTNS